MNENDQIEEQPTAQQPPLKVESGNGAEAPKPIPEPSWGEITEGDEPLASLWETIKMALKPNAERS